VVYKMILDSILSDSESLGNLENPPIGITTIHQMTGASREGMDMQSALSMMWMGAILLNCETGTARHCLVHYC
jgi:hypothetical protein